MLETTAVAEPKPRAPTPSPSSSRRKLALYFHKEQVYTRNGPLCHRTPDATTQHKAKIPTHPPNKQERRGDFSCAVDIFHVQLTSWSMEGFARGLEHCPQPPSAPIPEAVSRPELRHRHRRPLQRRTRLRCCSAPCPRSAHFCCRTPARSSCRTTARRRCLEPVRLPRGSP